MALQINAMAIGRKGKGHTNSADNARSLGVAVLSLLDNDFAADVFLSSVPPRASTAHPVRVLFDISYFAFPNWL